MTARSKVGIIILLGVIVIGGLLVLRQGPNQAASVAATSTVPAVAAGATPQSTPTAIPAPANPPTMTAEEQKAVETVKSFNPQSQASSLINARLFCKHNHGVP